MEKKGLILGWHQRYLLDDMHVELIRNGFKDKACSMPISALGFRWSAYVMLFTLGEHALWGFLS